MSAFRGWLTPMGSHYPVLAAAVAATQGPVLELGCGDFSTPMLHLMCRVLHRPLFTFDTSDAWLSRFMEYDCPGGFVATGHGVHLEKDWSSLPESPEDLGAPAGTRWGLAFVDCAPGEERPELVERLRDSTDLIVVHDTERDHDVGSVCRYDLLSASLKYAAEFRRFRPYTMVLSDVMPFEIDQCDREWIPPPDWDQIKHQK